MVKSKKPRKKRVDLPKTEKLKIAYEIKTGISTKEESMKKYNISRPTIDRIIRIYTDILEEHTEEAIDIKNNDIIKFEDGIFRCGLVKDRHNMPVKDFIFDKINNDLMFNFDNQEKIAEDYLIDNCIKKNKTHVVLYTSGLQSILATTIKVCSKLNLNLSIMHFNTSDNRYHEQKIFSTIDKTYTYLNIFTKIYKSVYLVGCTEKDLLNCESFYTVSSVNKSEKICYLCIDTDLAWKTYMDIVKERSTKNKKDRNAIFFESYIVSEDKSKFYRLESISKSV